LADEFAAELAAGDIPGYKSEAQGRSGSLELRHDDTAETGRPERGGVRRAKATWFDGVGNNRADFLTWRGEVQQFFPLWHSNRALALRGVISRIEDRGDGPVPFQRLLSNDDPDLFRGYRDLRFRDEGIVAASAEYRWPLWSANRKEGIGGDAYLFVDVGQVFGDFAEIDGDGLTKSYGGGIRAAGFGRYYGRLELAWSEEGVLVRLRGDQIFQWAERALFDGRPPVPQR
jgi:outer membrane protein assembly factor BamA